jgi:hypothetical protein
MFGRIATAVGINAFAAHKLTFASALQIHMVTLEHRVPVTGLMENPDFIPIYYFSVMSSVQMRKIISGEAWVADTASSLSREPLNSQQREGKVFKHQNDEAAS